MKIEKQTLTSAVLIATRNRIDDLIICLESLVRQTVAPTEIIVVDSSDESAEQERRFTKLFNAQCFPTSRLVYVHTDKAGLPRQRNEAIGYARSDVFHFFDDDVILEPDYLEQMHAIFEAHPAYAGGMGEVTNIPALKKNLFWWVKRCFGLQRIYASGGFTWSGMPLHAYGNRSFQDVEVLGGCCMAYRNDICNMFKFDEKLGRYAYMEDADYAWRVSRNHRLFFNPQARMKHMVSPQARDRLVFTRALYIKNYSYLFFKNVYPTNKFKVCAYWWTIKGLFVEGILLRSPDHIRGYCKGLWQFYTKGV